MKIGPPLDGVGDRHDRKWLEQHFKDPQSLSKGSKMPVYKFDAEQMDAICNYLLQMP
jgi:cbb3-type cytochrome oxidase cytochrome c subunit